MQLLEMQGLLAGKCLPGDMLVKESLAEYLLRKINERNEFAAKLEIVNGLMDAATELNNLAKENVEKLVAENVALKARTPFAYSYRYAGCETCDGFQDWRWELSKERPPEWMLETGKVTNLVELFECHETPATDAFTAELRAQGVDEFIIYSTASGSTDHDLTVEDAEEFAANLRAGRKG